MPALSELCRRLAVPHRKVEAVALARKLAGDPVVPLGPVGEKLPLHANGGVWIPRGDRLEGVRTGAFVPHEAERLDGLFGARRFLAESGGPEEQERQCDKSGWMLADGR